jgi:uncharacterized protein
VILVDANILIYAHVSSFAQHPAARGWLDQQLNGSGPVGLPWPSIVAFLRLVSNPRVFERPESIGDAWQQVHTWLAGETVWIPQPTERHAELLGEFLALPGMHGNLVPDAHLAALAVEHGLTLCSTEGNCDTLGPWSDFIKEFGFVLPKPSKRDPISDQNADVGARITIGAVRRCNLKRLCFC